MEMGGEVHGESECRVRVVDSIYSAGRAGSILGELRGVICGDMLLLCACGAPAAKYHGFC
jgi:hypothetical protein